MLVFSIPSVQTRLGKYATKILNEDFETNISIGKVGLQFNGDVELKEILIIDYRKEILISIEELNTSILNFKNLNDGKLVFGDIDLEGLIFNIKTYEGETDTNLDIFVARFDEENPQKSSGNFLLSSSDVSIYNGVFRLIDENRDTAKILEFKDININATNFLIKGSDVSTRINKLSFIDSRGLKMKNLMTDFSYTLKDMIFSNLQIETSNSTLNGDLKFLYKREDLKFFIDKVNVEATFTNTDISLNELNTFYNEFGVNQRASLNVDVSGTLNNLILENLELNTSSRSKVYGNINFKNLFNPDEDSFYMDGHFSNLSSNYKDLKALLPNVLGKSIPSVFNQLGDFKIVGQSQITASTVDANIKIITSLGIIDSNLKMNKIDDIDNALYDGNIIFDEFNLGEFLGDSNLKKISANLDVDGVGFTNDKINTQLNGNIFSIEYNEYVYEDIEVLGNVKDKIFNGKLVSKDQNLKLNFDGLVDFSKEVNTFDFVANVEYANLKSLNFAKKDMLSVFKGVVDMKMEGATINDAIGIISFNKTHYKNEIDDYYFNDFRITSTLKDNVKFIDVNSPDIIEGQLSGNFLFEDIGKLFENALGSIYANYIPIEVETNQYIDFNFKIYNKIVEVFYPEVELGKNTFVKGRVESDEKEFKLTFKSPRIKLFDYLANHIELQVDNKNPLFNTYVEIETFKNKFYDISDFNLINVTLKDTLFMRSEFKGGKESDDIYNLSFYHTINKENKSVLGFKTSDATFKGNTWVINEEKDNFNKIVFDKDLKDFKIDNFIMNHHTEEIKLAGVINDNTYKDIRLSFKNVDLNKILPEIDSLSLSGNVNGKLDIIQQNGNYLPNSTITIDNLEVNKLALGSFDAIITGNETLTSYSINAKIKDDRSESFSAVGKIEILDEVSSIDVDVNFDAFNLQPLNPFLDGVLSNIRALVTGEAKIIGDLKRPEIVGELILNKAGLTIPYLNVDYAIADNSSVTLQKQSFIFNDIRLTDTEYLSEGRLNGNLNHTNLEKWSLDLNLSTPRFLVLNTTETEESLYYGTGFIGGTASIHGPTNELVIKVEAETKEGTVFVIPLNDNESFGDNSYIHFLTIEEKKAKLAGRDILVEDITGLELDFDLDITQDAEIEIVMDKESGSTIRGRGEGGLLVEINTTGKFNIFGDFSVFEGNYNFLYGGLIQKDFVVQPGGTLSWDGPPLDARINIKAIYKTQANPSPLLDTPINRSIPVNLEISLTEQLEKPEINYDFEFPNLSSSIKSELQYRLESREDRENQALNLIGTGAFSSRANNLNFTGTITERLNGIVNGLLTSDDGKFNVNLNYELGVNTPEYTTDNRLGVTLQTKINDRILINGKVGVPVGGASETVVAGDVEIDFILNEDGTLVAKVFNRENSIRNFGEEIGYTQGIGIAYSVDFDSFKEFLQIIFYGKNKKEKKEEQKESIEEEALPPFIGFKKKVEESN